MQPGGASGELLGVDAVREFNVLRDSYGAEYGKHPGGQVIIVTQSGSNQLHGSAVRIFAEQCAGRAELFRSGFGAAFQRNQFGAALGGPDPKGQDLCLRQLRGLPAEPAPDLARRLFRMHSFARAARCRASSRF